MMVFVGFVIDNYRTGISEEKATKTCYIIEKFGENN